MDRVFRKEAFRLAERRMPRPLPFIVAYPRPEKLPVPDERHVPPPLDLPLEGPKRADVPTPPSRPRHYALKRPPVDARPDAPQDVP